MASEGYNGWKTYETWAVKLWLDNDYALYRAQAEWARDARSAAGGFRTPTGVLSDTLKDFVEECRPPIEGVWSDLLTAALNGVDWYEIAEVILTGTAEEEEEEGA